MKRSLLAVWRLLPSRSLSWRSPRADAIAPPSGVTSNDFTSNTAGWFEFTGYGTIDQRSSGYANDPNPGGYANNVVSDGGHARLDRGICGTVVEAVARPCSAGAYTRIGATSTSTRGTAPTLRRSTSTSTLRTPTRIPTPTGEISRTSRSMPIQRVSLRTLPSSNALRLHVGHQQLRRRRKRPCRSQARLRVQRQHGVRG